MPANFDVKLAANEVMVPRPEDLRWLHDELCKITGVDKQGYDIDATIRHERARACGNKAGGAQRTLRIYDMEI